MNAIRCSVWLVLARFIPMAIAADQFRPPAVPLVTHDPYFSVWSMSDRLTDDWPRHWTGAIQAMSGLIRIDQQPYRFIGPEPSAVPALTQSALDVEPTRTIYHFEGGGVRLTLTFTSPVLPRDLALVSRPVTYLSWEAKSTDGKSHQVTLYFDCTGEWAVNTPDQKVVAGREPASGLEVLRIGSADQPVLAKKGDNLRIDWGYLYVAAPKSSKTRITSAQLARETFSGSGLLPDHDDSNFPRPANDRWPVVACAIDLGEVRSASAEGHLLLAYDDLYVIEYFQRPLRAYWRDTDWDAKKLLETAEADYPRLAQECARFDQELMADLRKRGGEPFAQLAALAFRQCLAAHKLVRGPDGQPLSFPKENFSNGCIETVDVIYPSAPFFLLLNPAILEAQVVPIFDYAESPRWKFPFSPHDLGTYPKANGQVYGGGERTEENQMPVEESGNMLLMTAALVHIEGQPRLATRYWPLLQKWAEYLNDKGLDPENQLCTDDFAGHLAHNANLSVKAILALGAFGQLCEAAGKHSEGAEYHRRAQEMARIWAEKARDGNHYRLAFDRAGTWSQKYNLVWDRLLGLNLFAPEISRAEIAFYKTKLNRFGLPLDNRKDYTKTDWSVWTASLAESNDDFQQFIAPIYRFANESPSRVPFTDWYDTVTGKKVGFQARSVIGGIYIPMLDDAALWKKWAAAR